MPPPSPKPAELHALLAQLLAGAAGHDEAYWRDLISIERTNIVDDIRTNWRLVSKGSKGDQRPIGNAEAIVREAHPYVIW